jgi:hypothetical protein
VASTKNPSRPLSERERDILTALLEPDFPGAAELRAQVPRTEVTGRCPCGCPTVYLDVPVDVAPSPVVTRGGLAPVEAGVDTADHTVQQIILFVRDGRLAALETWWIDGATPAGWPPVDRLEVFQRDS